MTFSHAKKCRSGYDTAYRDELERFKTDINLTAYAAGQGYQLDRRASSRNSVLMRHPGGDKIVIARGDDQHWIYFSIRDESDNGSIIDFVLNRHRCDFGDVRRELRRWLGSAAPRIQPELYVREVVPVSRDRAGVIRALAGMRPVTRNAYLEGERGIPGSLLAHPRFKERVLVDARSNVVFPHHDRDGPCGYEIKNRRFTGFAPGGEKGLWVSGVRRSDTALVIAESALDALSYAVLQPEPHTRYASVGGKLNATQPALICSAIGRLKLGAVLRIATDNDKDGEVLGAELAQLAAKTGRGDLTVEFAVPADAKDWNDVLRGNCCLRSAWRLSKAGTSMSLGVDIVASGCGQAHGSHAKQGLQPCGDW